MHTFIFDFDATMYDERPAGSYIDMVYINAFQRLGIHEEATEHVRCFIREHKPFSPSTYAKAVANLHKTYKIKICQEDIDFAVQQLHKVQTEGLKEIVQAIAQQGHQVLIVGGTALGSHIIPLFVADHGIAPENVYSGYFNGLEEDEIMKALLGSFRYINAEEPGYITPFSERKSELINLLRSEGKTQNKIIHIGDGRNDLEAWENNAVDHFIGFGLNRVAPEVKASAPVFVESLEDFKKEIDDYLG